MDNEKPVKVVLMAALTKAIDKFYEIAYKDGNLEIEEIK